MTFQDLIENKEVKYVRNINSPTRLYIELYRDDNGVCTHSQINWPNGIVAPKIPVDSKNVISKSDSNNWQDITTDTTKFIEEHKKSLVEKTAGNDSPIDEQLARNRLVINDYLNKNKYACGILNDYTKSIGVPIKMSASEWLMKDSTQIDIDTLSELFLRFKPSIKFTNASGNMQIT